MFAFFHQILKMFPNSKEQIQNMPLLALRLSISSLVLEEECFAKHSSSNTREDMKIKALRAYVKVLVLSYSYLHNKAAESATLLILVKTHALINAPCLFFEK